MPHDRDGTPITHYDKRDFIYVLVRGETIDNKPFWAYVAILPHRYADFKAAEQSGDYTLNDYGEIIRKGTGIEPPDETKEYMKAEYGFSDDDTI